MPEVGRNNRSSEVPVGIKRFSSEAEEALRKQGFLIYDLTGQSIKTLGDKGHRLGSAWYKKFPDFEALRSMSSEVAVDPEKPFLPNSKYRQFSEQKEMVERFSQEIRKKVPGVKGIIGQVPDYFELILAHFDVTKQYLYYIDHLTNSSEWIRTGTNVDSRFVCFGEFIDPSTGLILVPGAGNMARVAPLLVPA